MRATGVCQHHEACGFQRISEEASQGTDAFRKHLAMTAINNLFERMKNALRTLRHIDAAELLQGSKSFKL